MQAHDFRALMQTDPHFEDDTRSAAFWMTGSFNEGSSWIGRFTGESPWERHATSDEFIHVVEGTVRITLKTEDGEESCDVPAGSHATVPMNVWHRVASVDGEVVIFGVTPCPTDHSEGDPT